MASGSTADARAWASTADLRKRTTTVAFSPQARLSSISELSNVPLSIADTNAMLDIEHLIHELIQRASDKLVGDAPALRHRLGLLQEVLREHRALLDDGRMLRPMDRLRHTLGQINLTLQQARSSIWFRRRSRFKQPIRLQIDDLNDAISLIRLTGMQIRSGSRPSLLGNVERGERPDPALSTSSIGAAEAAYLNGDRFYFGRDSVQCYATARRHYEQAAQAEYGPALNALAVMYRDGRGAPADTATALQYFERAVKAGNTDAIYNLAVFRWSHAKTASEAAATLALLRTAVNQEHVQATTMLGWLHDEGDNRFQLIEQDHDTAERLSVGTIPPEGGEYGLAATLPACLPAPCLKGRPMTDGRLVFRYRRAAESGNVKAQNHLGHLLYRLGQREVQHAPDSVEGRSRLELALTLFRSSADQGDASALNNLAICYEQGLMQGALLQPDPILAERLYERAANLGHGHAAANLGRLLMRRQRHDQARYHLQRAGTAPALTQLGLLYRDGNLRCPSTAFEYLSRAAALGDARGQYEAAQMLFSGVGTSPDVVRAFDLYKRSAVQGYGPAQNALGVMLQEGVPVVLDLDQAKYWFEKGAAQLEPDALCNLAAMYENGAGVQVDLAHAQQLYIRAKEAGSVQAGLRLLELSQQ